MLEHEAGEGDEVEACECFGQAFIVADEAPEAGSPGEGAFDDPTPGQEDEAALGLGQGGSLAGSTLAQRQIQDGRAADGRAARDFLPRSQAAIDGSPVRAWMHQFGESTPKRGIRLVQYRRFSPSRTPAPLSLPMAHSLLLVLLCDSTT